MLKNLYLFIKKKVSNDIKVVIKHYFYLLTKKDYRQMRLRNKKYKNIALGKRCFILGNGPSLNDINIELLKNEDIFTVNQINRSPIFNKIKPKYHCIADADFFYLDDKDPGQAERLKYIKQLQSYEDLVCIFPCLSKKFFDSLNFSNKIIYYNTYQDAEKKAIKHFDMTLGIPSIRTVVQVAIYSAIYFGYQDIYLLGVENTNYSSLLNKIDEIDSVENAHAYNYTNTERDEILKKKNNHNNEFVFENFYNLFKIYSNINRFCKNNNIVIKNLTGSGILDIFEKDRLENIIQKTIQI